MSSDAPAEARATTPAAEMPNQVHEATKTARVDALTALSDQLHAEYVARHKGTTQQVLFESTQKGGMMYGYTGNYIRVERPYDKNKIGQIVEEII